MSTTASVPSPREILTSILTTLSSYDPADHQPPSNQNQRHHHSYHNYNNNNQQPPNPLKLIPNSHRALLSTLHVLYPSTLLPALDLLDRNLVTRVVVASSAIISTTTSTTTTATAEPHHQPKRTFHLVRSAQGNSSTTRRRHHNHATTMDNPSISSVLHDTSTTTTSTGGGAGGKVYVVRLDAWNCSCAAFAFSAFPSEGSMFTQRRPRWEEQRQPPPGVDVDVDVKVVDDDNDEENNTGDDRPHFKDGYSAVTTRNSGYDILPAKVNNDYIADDDEDSDLALECGGLSIDGLPGSGIPSVPCCKHLLACLLGERWPAVLGIFIQERVVGREEGAGLMTDV